jgi:release factor glutamine methyltransferase
MSADTSLTVTATEKKTWTILEILGTTSNYLKAKGVDDARLNAELLLARVLDCRRIDLYANFDKPVRESEREQYKALLRRRTAHEPLQYILGETEFMGLRFVVDRRVLIPRPETEVLVERVIEVCRQFPEGTERISLLDIGTGCGNIAVSVARFVVNAYITAIDNSAEALEVARENIQSHNLAGRVTLGLVDILHNPVDLVRRAFDIVVSNPPYVSQQEFKSLPPEIRDYEPPGATCDSSDGLTFYRRISDIGKQLLKEGGLLILEIGFGQSGQVQAILRERGYEEIQINKDYGGVERVVQARASR